MMSLVAYDASSDEDSDNDSIPSIEQNKNSKLNDVPETVNTNIKRTTLKLPSPSDYNTTSYDQSNEALKFNLPAPAAPSNTFNINEDDDEFLRKKAKRTEVPPVKKRGTVRITIPSLSNFESDKSSTKIASAPLGPNIPKSCGLLGLLPKPKIGFQKNTNGKIDSGNSSSSLKLIPKSVSDKAANAKTINTSPATNTSTNNSTKVTKPNYDSDDADDEESGDFFSLNSKEDLPTEKLETISQLIAEKVKSIAKTANRFELSSANVNETEAEVSDDEAACISKMDHETMQALCGSSAKRSRIENVDIIELSGDQVLPNRDEWLRHQLTAATEYQPRGLVDEEPAAGTRKKHQITYLAHQAKANELELQAMWASNRHARRLTQNKYGF